MKRIIYILSSLLLFSCSNENTDATVNQNVNPVQVKMAVDTIPPHLDTLLFNKLALDCFYHLGYSTGGAFYYKSAIESVHNTIMQVIRDHGENGSDIVFLIDKTGSMQEDIDSVRINLNAIIDQIERLKDIRLGVAVYGDKNVDGANWWSNTEMTSDYKIIRNYINKLQVSDGGDYPESVYDGLGNVITKTKWRKNSKKMVLIIGDAPSLEDSLSAYSRQQILDLCLREGIKANLFPVLVTPFKAESFVEASQYYDKVIEKIYPNPASDHIQVKLLKGGEYVITLMDLTGKVAVEKTITGSEAKLEIPAEIPDGAYILRVLNPKTQDINAERVLIKR